MNDAGRRIIFPEKRNENICDGTDCLHERIVGRL